MVWNPVWPDGTKSVAQNNTPGQQNTGYIETNLNRDHFWNIGTNEDGYHRKVSMENFEDTATGAPTDPTIPVGMDGVIYLKDNGSGQSIPYYRNNAGIQPLVAPATAYTIISGTVSLSTGSAQNIVAVPNNTYGYMFIWRGAVSQVPTFAHFRAENSVVQPWPHITWRWSSGQESPPPIILLNGSNSTTLTIRGARSGGSGSEVYNYRVIYWPM